jgi:hypothetical protein
VKGRGYLGIYLNKDSATVVCLGLEGGSRNVLGCFTVTVEEQEEQKLQELVRLIAEGCAERLPMYEGCEVAVALDCAMFMQHNVHSEFADPKQIAATVRFDAEEALAMDITDLAIAFKATSSDQSGSALTVFTAQRKMLSDILIALQSNNIDPVTVEPDVNCLSRFILQRIPLPDDSHALLCVLSDSSGYFITFAKSHETPAVRTFLLRPSQGREELLAREVQVTAALAGTDDAINCVRVFDSTGSVDHQQLSDELSIEVGSVDLVAAAATVPEALTDCAGPVDFAIAYGAALSCSEKVHSVNFRDDFMPYQGKKVRLQKAMKFLGVCAAVLMLALGLYFQLQLWQRNKYRSQLRKKFEKEYSAVMFGKKPPSKTDAVRKLSSEFRRIQDVKSGQLSVTGEESVAAKLTLVLDAFNKCAARTNLTIESISITAKAIIVRGDTSSRKNTLKLFETMEQNRLDVLTQRLDAKGGRDNFSITVAPKK